ncbi:ran-binding protein 1 homolog b-like [Impatiens glandulifera]|uniref:ran-binding protein 1 homolog b-like n=1 Tax=Impatiens glandulifera TaxID=253017 RepID=UPI001FB051D7|nr:ran-binding protein 1 homolog b-like [Impatiens glandulifera]
MASSTEPQHREEEEEASETGVVEDEDTGAQIAPIIKLQEVAVSTGEEDEDILLDLKAKLYRFDKESNQWKERGTGTVKLLKHKESGKVRLVMRQSKTLKICANHFVSSSITLQEHAGNEKSCVWHASDFADGELKEELFCIRFASIENCQTFKSKVEEIAQAEGGNTEESSEEAASTATLLEKLTVKEETKVEEDKPKEKKEEEKKEEAKEESATDEK